MNMGMMDVPTLEPLATALPQLLHEHGRCVANICIAQADSYPASFVATILHPAFMTSDSSRNMSLAESPTTGRYETKHSTNVARYLDVGPARAEALHGQPAVQIWLSIYLPSPQTILLRPNKHVRTTNSDVPSSRSSTAPSKTCSVHSSSMAWYWMGWKNHPSRVATTGRRSSRSTISRRFRRSWHFVSGERAG